MSEKKRLNVHLYVTPICNLQCGHCSYESWPTNSVPDRLLTIDEISRILVNLCDAYEADVHIEGGEMFLREDIGALFELVPAQYWSNVTMTTNGIAKIRVDHRYLRYLADLRVSVEGHTDELQQDIRGIPLRPVLKTCSDLQASGVPVTLRITLTKKNHKQLVAMMNYFVDLGFPNLSIYEFQPVGRGHTHAQEYGLKSAEVEDTMRLLTSNSIPDGMETFKLSLNASRVPLVIKYQEELTTQGLAIVNLPSVPSLTINYNGDLGICPWNVGHERIGVLRTPELCTDVARHMESGRLYHSCDHCSAIRILYQRRR